MQKLSVGLCPLAGVAVAYVVGTAFGEYALAKVPTLWSLVAVCCGIVVAQWLSCKVGRSVQVATAGVYMAVFLGAAFFCQLRMYRPMLSLAGKTLGYTGVVLTEPQQHGKIVVFDMLIARASHAEDDSPVDHFHPLRATALLLCDTITHHYENLHVGVAFTAMSTFEPRKSLHPSPANRNQWQTFIPYWNWQLADVGNVDVGLWQRLRISLLQLRHSLAKSLQKSGGENSGSAAAIIAAMTLGDRSGIGKQTLEDFSVSGASHVLALSGLHLSILYGAFLWIVGRKRRVLSQVLCLSVVWLYAILVGLTPSVVRAATMLSVYGVVDALQRERQSLNTLSIAAIVMLAIRPQNLWEIGFQMSFLAVLGILLFFNPVYRFLTLDIFSPTRSIRERAMMKKRTFARRAGEWLLGIIIVSMVAQLMVAPLVAYYFGRFSCYFLLTNIVAIPLVTLILLTALTYFVLYFSPFLQDVVGQMLVWLTNVLASVLHFIADLPGASIDGIHLSPLQLLLVYLLEATVCYLVVRLIYHFQYWYRMMLN